MMKKYTFDAKNGLWYEQCREYQLSCLTVPNSKMIGRWGPGNYNNPHFNRFSISSEILIDFGLTLFTV